MGRLSSAVRGVLGGIVVTAVAVAAPAVSGAEEPTETSFSYTSQPGDYIGQGRSGTLTDPASFRVRGTAGRIDVSVDGGSEWWQITLTAPEGQQLTTGTYENISRAGFNTTYAGLDVSSTGRGCNQTKGRFTVYAISADTGGQVTSLDAAFTQFCDSSSGGLSGAIRYAAPVGSPVVVTSSNPSTVAGQPVTLTARVAPGTGAGGVVFYDGGASIGQGSFDASGTARLTTGALAVGTHSVTARVGTTVSPPATQEVRDGATSLWFLSPYGDYIGQGGTASHAPPSASVAISGGAAALSVSVDSPSTDQWWTVDLAAPPGETLRTGTYTGAVRAPFRGPGQAGLSVSGTGRGCNALSGSFTVAELGVDASGAVTALDATFTQHCDGDPVALTGRVRWNAGSASTVTSTTLDAAATGPLEARLVATVTGGGGVAGGQVVFTEGGVTLGTATLDASGRATLVTSLTRGTHTLTASYAGGATAQPSSGTAQVTLAGMTTTTEASAPPRAKAGKELRVDVVVRGSGSAAPGGTVRLYDGVEPVATAVTLVGGSATMVWTPVAKGQRELTVRYSGDDRFAGSVSRAVTVRVN